MTTTSTALARRENAAPAASAPAVIRKRPDERLVDYVTACWRDAEDATRQRRAQWRELWDAYQGRQNTRGKADWQSKLFVPKVWMAVEKASAEIRRAMLQTQKLFKLELDDSAEKAQLSTFRRAFANATDAARMANIQQQIRDVKRSLEDQLAGVDLDDARFKSDLTLTNLAKVYSEMSKVAFLLGIGNVKVGWNFAAKRVLFRDVDPFNLAVCPDWEPSGDEPPAWIIERIVMRLPDLYEAAKGRNDRSGEQVYDVAALDQVGSDYVAEDQDEQDRRRGIGFRTPPAGRVELLMFWGNLPSEDFKGYDARNILAVVGNRRHRLRRSANPFDHGKAPYILTMPLTFPFRGHSGSSLVEPIVRINYTYNNILNLFVDGLNFTINKQYQLDPNKLRDPRQMNTVYPGKIWKVNTGSDNRAVLQEVPMGVMGPDALRALEILSKDAQESTGVTEFLQGMPGRQVKTLGEIQIKTQESRGLFDVTARDMEQFSLQPMLEMAYDVLVQMSGYPERQGRYHVNANGLSALVGQAQLLESIGSILMVALKSPALGRMTKIADLYQRFLSIHNLSDCYQEPPEAATEALTPEQQNAMATKAERDAKATVAGMTPEQIQEAAP
jgi:hypothetical protein